MSMGWKIGFATLTGIGIGTWVKLRFYPNDNTCRCNAQHDVVKKNIGALEQQDDFSPEYLKDLKQWGTRQGVIDVSNDALAAKKKRKKLKKIPKQGKAVTQRYLAAKTQQYLEQGKKIADDNQLLSHLKKEVKTTQITLKNTSLTRRAVTLWEANRSTALSPPLPTDVQDHTVLYELVVADTVHPQGMAFNPKNQCVYTANQLSNDVSVVGKDGQIIALIQLEPSVFPGLCSPVAIAIHSHPESALYGYAYVVGSVSNTVSVINTDFEVVATVPVGVRPLAIAFNPAQDCLIVTHYAQDSISIIDVNTLDVQTIAVGKNPLGVAVNPLTGTVYVANSGEDTVHVLDDNYTFIRVVNGLGRHPTNMAYHGGTDKLYIVLTETHEVVVLDATTHQVMQEITVGQDPYAILNNPNNDFIYVACRTDNQITILAPDHSIQAVLHVDQLNNGMAFHSHDNILFTSAASGQINTIGYLEQSSAVVMDEGLAEKNQEFQYNPILIKHAKFILSGEERFKTLKLTTAGATGNSTTQTISFGAYDSPQNRQNISEVYGLKGTVIDGAHGWEFDIAPKQTITILIYYHPFDRYSLLPETTSKSMGVEMSKGMAKSLSYPHSQYNPLV